MTSFSSTTNEELVSCKTLSTFACHEMNPRPKYNEINFCTDSPSQALTPQARDTDAQQSSQSNAMLTEMAVGANVPRRAPGPRRVSRALIVRVLLLVERAPGADEPSAHRPRCRAVGAPSTLPSRLRASLFDGTHPQSKLFKESSCAFTNALAFGSAIPHLPIQVAVRLGHLFTGCTALLSRGDAAAYQRAAELLHDLQKELKSVDPIVQDLLSVAPTAWSIHASWHWPIHRHALRTS
ncbi:hypothetical protein T492DRAFT_869018 [Pavlovales sp. CCMP2436]|nr:hypothetical protein T492DRAFT_869018 [Pavlovales sp. CCMP2436]